MTKAFAGELSGYSYISIRVRENGTRTAPLRLVSPRNCNHGGEDNGYDDRYEGVACETAECLNSWSLDHQFYLRRTARGRLLIARFALTDDEVNLLASPDFRDIRTTFDPFDQARYDRTRTSERVRD